MRDIRLIVGELDRSIHSQEDRVCSWRVSCLGGLACLLDAAMCSSSIWRSPALRHHTSAALLLLAVHTLREGLALEDAHLALCSWAPLPSQSFPSHTAGAAPSCGVDSAVASGCLEGATSLAEAREWREWHGGGRANWAARRAC